MKRKQKCIALYLDGKEHIKDVLDWALCANMSLDNAKKHLLEYYKDLTPKIVLK